MELFTTLHNVIHWDPN